MRRFLFVAWALAGIFATSSELKQSAFCASLAFRWTSYSLSRTGDRSGEAEGSCAFFFFDFGLRAVALPLPPAGAIVGDRFLEWKFKEGDRFKATTYFLCGTSAGKKMGTLVHSRETMT